MNKYLLIMALAVVSLSQSTHAGGLLSAAGDVAAGTVAAATAPLGGRAYYGPGYYRGSRVGYFNDPADWYTDGYYDYGPGYGYGIHF